MGESRDSVDPSAAPPASLSLKESATIGVKWSALQALSTRAVNGLLQLFLSYLLAQSDFGLIALVYTATFFIQVVDQAGVGQVLIQNPRRARSLESPAFWLSVTTGLCGLVLMHALAWPVAAIYGQPKIVPLMLVLAWSSPLRGLLAVPTALLRTRLQFRALAQIEISAIALQAAFTLALAAAGAGALSFVLPVPITLLLKLGVTWMMARPRLSRHFQIRRWRFLYGKSVFLILSNLLLVGVSQGDRIALGLFHDETSVGLYFFAFMMASQSVMLLTFSLTSVLFPVLSQLSAEPARQAAAYIHSAKILALVSFGFCFAQAICIRPVFLLLFEERWHAAIPIAELLSVGLCFRVVGSTGGSLLMAQGRFRTRFLFSVMSVVLLAALVVPASAFGHSGMVALAMAGYFVLVNILNPWIALGASHPAIQDVVSIYARPTAAATLSFGLCWIGLSVTHFSDTNPFLSLLAAPIAGFAGYGALSYWLMPKRVAHLDQAVGLTTRMRRLRS